MSITGATPYKIGRKLARAGDGVAVTSITADLVLTLRDEDYQNIAADAARNIDLPAVTDPNVKGCSFTIFNASAGASTLTVRLASAGATVVAIPQGGSAKVACNGTTWKKVVEVGTNAGSSLLSTDNAWTGTQDISKSVTGTDELVNADLSINHATQIGVAVDAQGIQLTTARTANYVAAFRGSTTSLAADTATVIYPTYLAAAPVDGGAALHHAYKTAAGYDATIDAQAAATGENDWIVGANLADAFSFRTTTLNFMTLKTTTASPGIVETWAHTGTAQGHALSETITHATQVGGGFDSDVSQLTNARTGGYLSAYRAKTTSLAGDLNGVPYAGFYALAPTDGGGAVLHSGLYVEAGNDYSVHGLDNVRTAWGTGAAGVADATMGWDATILSLLCAVDDSIWKIGNGTNSFDVWTYGNTASDYMEWDASANALIMRGAAHIVRQTIVAATGTAIPVTHSGSFPITQNGAETNTLADPTFIGQSLSIFVDTDTSGARVITAASRINQAANTIITLTEVGDFIKLEAITIAGALKWQVVANDGAVLS